jgi:murein DD-endopeptidase MepM/ murein hydrolase activator NlpD
MPRETGEKENRRGTRGPSRGRRLGRNPDRDDVNAESARGTLSRFRTRKNGGLVRREMDQSAETPTRPEAAEDIPGRNEPTPRPYSKDDRRREAPGAARRRPRLLFEKEEMDPALTVSEKASAAKKRRMEAAAKPVPKSDPAKTHGAEKPTDGAKPKKKQPLLFEDGVKPKRASHKGPSGARPADAAGGVALTHAHRKIHEAEDGNVGVEAAHKGELMAEGGLRLARRYRRDTPQRRTLRLEHRQKMHRSDASPRKTMAWDTKKDGAGLYRAAQKRKIKRGYAKAVRDAKKNAGRARKAGGAVKKVTRGIATSVRSHPVVFLVIGLIALLVIILMAAFSSCSNMASGAFGAFAPSSYLAPDSDIEEAELSYTEWETDIQIDVARAEATHPGYDEYRYSVDDIGHDPYSLMAYLTAVYNDFLYPYIEPALRDIFGQQYALAYTPVTEIRYRTVVRTNPETGESYYEVEAYEWHILNVTLTARSFSDVVAPQMDADQLQRYAVIRAIKGNRQYVGSPFPFNWLPYVSDGYGWRTSPASGGKDCHKGVDIAVGVGTEILAAHDGVVTLAGNSGGYGLTVIVDGVTDDGGSLTTKYAHCSQILVSAGQTVKAGDAIAKVGSTGNAAGPRLHFEVLVDGRNLNPLYFAFTNDDGSSYVPPGTPGGAEIPPYPGEPMDDERANAMIEEAKKHLGKPYVFGASGPDKFDCSGFVCYVINHSGVGNVGRTSAQGLYNLCTPVSRADARPGDLIFFTGTYDSGHPVTHIGIYIGNGQMIHAGKPVQYASIDTAYFKQHFYAFGRL